MTLEQFNKKVQVKTELIKEAHKENKRLFASKIPGGYYEKLLKVYTLNSTNISRASLKGVFEIVEQFKQDKADLGFVLTWSEGVKREELKGQEFIENILLEYRYCKPFTDQEFEKYCKGIPHTVLLEQINEDSSPDIFRVHPSLTKLYVTGIITYEQLLESMNRKVNDDSTRINR